MKSLKKLASVTAAIVAGLVTLLAGSLSLDVLAARSGQGTVAQPIPASIVANAFSDEFNTNRGELYQLECPQRLLEPQPPDVGLGSLFDRKCQSFI